VATSIPRFNLQKNLFRSVYILMAVMLVAMAYYAYQIEMRVQQERNISEAPFTENTGREQSIRPIPIDKPHRTARELSNWVNIAVAEALSFDSSNYEARLREVRPYFTEEGYNQYRNYLAEARFKESLNQNDLRVSVIAEQMPLLLNDENIRGVYRWLFQVPVTMSFVPEDLKSYRPETRPINRRLLVRVQLGRVNLPRDPNAVRIESWEVLANRQ